MHEIISAIIQVAGAALVAWFITNQLEQKKYAFEKDRAFRQLFVDFNAKFNLLNEPLNEVVELSIGVSDAQAEVVFETLNPLQKNAVYDYLNLGAEEYFWCFKRKERIIDMLAWEAGMKDYLDAALIRHYFKVQAAYPISYYGFYDLKWLKDALTCIG